MALFNADSYQEVSIDWLGTPNMMYNHEAQMLLTQGSDYAL